MNTTDNLELTKSVQFTWQRQITDVYYHNGQPYWVLAQICQVCGIKQPVRVAERLRPEEKLRGIVFTPGGSYSRQDSQDLVPNFQYSGGGQYRSGLGQISGQNREMWLINESGLYSTVFQSRKPEAQEFRYWITSEVLPTLRRTGFYVMDMEPIKAQVDWAFHCQRESRKLLRRLNVLQEQRISGLVYARASKWFAENGHDIGSKEGLALSRQLLILSREMGLKPIAQPQMPGIPTELQWPLPVLERCLSLMPPKAQFELPLGN